MKDDSVPSLQPQFDSAQPNFEILDTVESRMDISNVQGFSEEEKDHEVSYDLDRDELDG